MQEMLNGQGESVRGGGGNSLESRCQLVKTGMWAGWMSQQLL